MFIQSIAGQEEESQGQSPGVTAVITSMQKFIGKAVIFMELHYNLMNRLHQISRVLSIMY